MNSTCCCCWEKYGERSKSLKKMNKNLEEQIQMFIFPGYTMNNDCNPSVVCPGCRRNLYRLKKGDSPRGEWGAKVEWKTLLRNSPRTSLTLPDEITNFPTTKSSIRSFCYSLPAPGYSHNCTPTSPVANIITLSFLLGSLQAEQVASGIIKSKMATESLVDGSTFCLSTGGNPLKVTVGIPENKSKRTSIKQLSIEIIKQLQIVLELSNRKTKEMLSTLRKGLGNKLSIEPNIFGRLSELEEYISNYEGISTLNLGTKRTLGSIDYWYNKYLENNSVKSSMQEFMNCINSRILYINLDPNTLIEQLIPPPELHLLIGFVSLLGNFLLDVWPGFDDWLKSKNVIQRGYQGRGWDGNNSNKILENLDSLETQILETFTCLIPIVQCLRDFRNVKNCCFSSNLQTGFKEAITNLKNSFLSAQEVAVNLNKQINTTWKVHILLCHVQPYVEHHNKGLGNFAEQCGESIHAKFKPTWTRFKRQIEHSEHGDRLLSAAVDFGAKRI
nr:uncharacterized protein LOC105844349 isoform X2 [Hydra vulgaris]